MISCSNCGVTSCDNCRDKEGAVQDCGNDRYHQDGPICDECRICACRDLEDDDMCCPDCIRLALNAQQSEIVALKEQNNLQRVEIEELRRENEQLRAKNA